MNDALKTATLKEPQVRVDTVSYGHRETRAFSAGATGTVVDRMRDLVLIRIDSCLFWVHQSAVTIE
jgi:hypothetical protein